MPRGLHDEYFCDCTACGMRGDPQVRNENTMKPAKKGAHESPNNTTATGKKSKGFTDEERVAMRERRTYAGLSGR